jgi:hypothetical protein
MMSCFFKVNPIRFSFACKPLKQHQRDVASASLFLLGASGGGQSVKYRHSPENGR